MKTTKQENKVNPDWNPAVGDRVGINCVSSCDARHDSGDGIITKTDGTSIKIDVFDGTKGDRNWHQKECLTLVKSIKTDYTGCHPEIAASLKRGEHIECRHPEDHSLEFTVTSYCAGLKYRYGGFRNGLHDGYSDAEPVPKTKTRVLGPVQLMQALVERGYKVSADGCWSIKRSTCVILPSMWEYCGQTPCSSCSWEPWMLEEVEL